MRNIFETKEFDNMFEQNLKTLNTNLKPLKKQRKQFWKNKQSFEKQILKTNWKRVWEKTNENSFEIGKLNKQIFSRFSTWFQNCFQFFIFHFVYFLICQLLSVVFLLFKFVFILFSIFVHRIVFKNCFQYFFNCFFQNSLFNLF